MNGKTEMPQRHEFRYPNETEDYRVARNALLKAERKHRQQTEELARMRRSLPLGGTVPEDYLFVDRHGENVSMSELFGPDHDVLVVYSFMFPTEGLPCPMCTAFLDGLNGNAPHLHPHASLAVVAQASPEELDAFATTRHWPELRLLSCGGTGYGLAYGGEDRGGNQLPMLNVFHRSAETVRHFYGTELFFTPPEEGQHPRHVDPMWSLWNILDVTPFGRPSDWWPRIDY